MAQINPRTFADAKQLADNVYELILINWGNRSATTQDPNNGSISYPPVKSIQPTGAIPILPVSGDFLLPAIPSVAAIAIAPRSTVDRCIINYTTLPQTPPQTLVDPFNSVQMPCTIEQGFINKGGILETEQVLSNDSPLIGQQPGPIIIRAHPFGWFSSSYTPVVGSDPAQTAFGPGMAGGSAVGGTWVGPQLRLLLYLTGSAALPPQRRAPFHLAFDAAPGFPGAGLDEVLKVVPIMGRRRVRVTVRVFGPNPDRTFRLTGMFQVQDPNSNGPPPPQPNYVVLEMPEVELAAAVTVAADSSYVFELDQPGVPFLAIRGRSGFINAFTSISIDAWD